MRIEVLCTGDELLNGTIADTNSPWFMNNQGLCFAKLIMHLRFIRP